MAKNKQKPRLRNRVAGAAIDTVVPRQKNHYRPHLTNRYGMSAIVLLVMAFAVGFVQQHPAVLGSQAGIQTPELLSEVNVEREATDLPPLKMEPRLTRAAESKARDMLKYQYWAHESPTGVTPWKWVNEAGYSYAYAGENLAKNFATAGSTVAAWMASEGHRRNLLHEYYTDAGFAVVDGELDGANVTLVVALFATPAASLTSVAGATTYAPKPGGINPFERFGIILQSSNSTATGIIGLTLIALVVALVAFIVTHWTLLSSKRKASHKKASPAERNRAVAKVLVLATLTVAIGVMLGGGQL